MRIDISLDTKSIKSSIKRLKKIQQNYPKMIYELLEKSAEWIKQKANDNLLKSGIGENVIKEIQNGWQEIKPIGNTVILTNSGRGYMIEFGVGVLGENTYQGDLPLTYEYNVMTEYKMDDGSWVFTPINNKTEYSLADIDIRPENIIDREEHLHSVKTQGNQATMFLHQAVMDFRSKNIAQEIFAKIWEKYTK